MPAVFEKIDAFEKHILDRQLRIAQILGQHFLSDDASDPLSESAFAILNLSFNYFEMIEQFATGQASNNQSALFFERGFRRVFSSFVILPPDVTRIYKMLRCGMYHTAMPKDRCGLSRELKTPIMNDNGVVLINPAYFVDAIIVHFENFCSDLRDGHHCQLQTNFATMWDNVSNLCRGSGAVSQTSLMSTPEPTFNT